MGKGDIIDPECGQNGSKIQVCVSLTEKAIPYHEENFARFLQKFDTK